MVASQEIMNGLTQDNIAYYEYFKKPKIVYVHTAKEHYFYFDFAGRYINNSCYMIVTESKYLFFYLNSKLFRWLKRIKFVAYGDASEAGRVKLDYNKMITIPVKVIGDSVSNLFDCLYQYLQYLHHSKLVNS